MSERKKKRESDPDEKPYLVFDLKRGYVWGPGHKKWAGQPATWSGPGNEGGVTKESEPL